MNLRADLAVIAQLVNPGARVLDLGCGEGDLLAHLQMNKEVNGYGLDVDPDNIRICIEKGVNVVEQNLDDGLDNFGDSVSLRGDVALIGAPQIGESGAGAESGEGAPGGRRRRRHAGADPRGRARGVL